MIAFKQRTGGYRGTTVNDPMALLFARGLMEKRSPRLLFKALKVKSQEY